MEIDEAIKICQEHGFRVTKIKKRSEGATVNPFGHPYPHAKLINNTLTSIKRLYAPYGSSMRFVGDNA